MILEQERNVLKQILIKDAKDKLTDKITDNILNENWEGYDNAAADLINANTKPGEQVNNQHLLAAC